MRKKTIPALIVGLTLLVGGSSALAKSTTIKYMFWGNADDMKIEQAAINDFQKKNPDIKVTPIMLSSTGYIDKLLIELAAGTAPDVVLINGYHAMGLLQKNMLVNLTPYAKRDNYDLNAFVKSAVEPCSWKGNWYGVNARISPMTLFYNKRLFSQAGVVAPKEWSISDMVAVAKKISKDSNGDGKLDITGLEKIHQTYIPHFVYSYGGRFFNDDGSKCLLNTAEAIDGLQMFADLWQRTDIHGQKLADNKAAMQWGWATKAMELNKYPFKTDLGILPLPMASKKITVSKGNIIGVPNSSKNKDAAWQFIKYLGSADAQLHYAMNGKTVPIRKEVLKNKAYLENEQFAFPINITVEAMEDSVPLDTPPAYREIFENVIQPTLIARAFDGKVAVRSVMNSIWNQVEAKMKVYNDRYKK